MLCSFFLLSHSTYRRICTRFSSLQTKCDWPETLTQCAEWIHFVVSYFSSNLIYFIGVFRSSDIACSGQQHTIHRSVAASRWHYVVIANTFAAVWVMMLVFGEGIPAVSRVSVSQTEFLFTPETVECNLLASLPDPPLDCRRDLLTVIHILDSLYFCTVFVRMFAASFVPRLRNE